MAWNVVRNVKRERRLAKDAANDAARQMAQELRRALFAGSISRENNGGQSGRRGPQGTCDSCGGLPNDMSRSVCRGCGLARPSATPNTAPVTARSATRMQAHVAPTLRPPHPVRSAWMNVLPAVREAASAASYHAKALERAARTVRCTGAASATRMEDEARAARAAAVAAKPATVREAQRPTRLREAETAATKANEALASATAHAENAHAKVDKIKSDLAAAEAAGEHGVKSSDALAPLLAEAQHLLVALENGLWRSANGGVGGAPASVLDAMRALRGAVAAAAPPIPEPSLDAALPERTLQAGKMRGRENWAAQSETEAD